MDVLGVSCTASAHMFRAYTHTSLPLPTIPSSPRVQGLGVYPEP